MYFNLCIDFKSEENSKKSSVQGQGAQGSSQPQHPCNCNDPTCTTAHSQPTGSQLLPNTTSNGPGAMLNQLSTNTGSTCTVMDSTSTSATCNSVSTQPNSVISPSESPNKNGLCLIVYVFPRKMIVQSDLNYISGPRLSGLFGYLDCFLGPVLFFFMNINKTVG